MLEKKKIEKALLNKGFKVRNNDHEFFHFVYNNKITAIRTKLSFGSKYKDIGESILNSIKMQLFFDRKKDLLSFIDCTYTQNDYISLLLGKGKL